MEYLTIALETSSPTGSVSLYQGEEPLESCEFESTRQVDTTLFPPLKLVLSSRSGEQLQVVLVGTGPGSYNGARAGIAAAQALGLSHQAKVIGLPSFLSLPSVVAGNHVHVIGDARRGEYFCITCQHGRPTRAVQLLQADDFCAFLESTPLPLIAPQPGDTFPFKQNAPPIQYELPHAEGLIQAWLNLSAEQQHTYQSAPVEAYYLRPPHITASKKGHPLLRKKNP